MVNVPLSLLRPLLRPLSLLRPSSGRALSQLARLFRRRHGDLNVWNEHQEIPESINLYKSTGLRSILIPNARHFLPYKPEPSS